MSFNYLFSLFSRADALQMVAERSRLSLILMLLLLHLVLIDQEDERLLTLSGVGLLAVVGRLRLIAAVSLAGPSWLSDWL